MYDESQLTPYSEPQTNNSTKFHSNEAVAQQSSEVLEESSWELREKWKRFHGYNNGLWNGKWADKKKLFAQDNDRIFDSIAGQIGLTRYQKDRGRSLFQDIHHSSHGSYYRVVDIAFYVCVLVANEEYAGKGRIYHPGKKNYSHPVGIDHVGDPHESIADLVEKIDLDIPDGKIVKGLEKFRRLIDL